MAEAPERMNPLTPTEAQGRTHAAECVIGRRSAAFAGGGFVCRCVLHCLAEVVQEVTPGTFHQRMGRKPRAVSAGLNA